MRVKLPLISQEKKWFVAAAGYVVFCVLYLLTGNFHLRVPTMLTPSAIDEKTPFLAWTVWIYNSQFFFLAISIYLMREPLNLSRTLYAMALVSLFSFVTFTVFPTTLPRDYATGTGITAKAFQSLYAIDSSSNCFPSLHVALAWLAALGVWQERRSLGMVICLWAVLITISTMTTKQHYFIDVIAGLFLAALFRMLLMRVELMTSASPQLKIKNKKLRKWLH
jgi:membrane-associated phospholipid phosphatase